MNKILVPVDFSERTQFAYDLAYHLAEKLNAQIHALTVVPGPQGVYYDEMGEVIDDEGLDMSEYEAKKEELLQQMKKWAEDKRRVSSYLVKIGNVENDIRYYAEHNNIDLIVMGTEGSYDNSWFGGTHTQHITNTTKVPVMSLKCDRSNIDLNEMVLVSDFIEEEVLDLDIIKDIQHAFMSNLVLLFVKTPGNKETREEILLRMAQFVKRNDLKRVEYHVYEDKAVESGIGKFVAERDIDLILLGTHQKQGFSKLFRKNISDDVVNHMFHPILTFPIREQK